MTRLTHRDKNGKAFVWIYADPNNHTEVIKARAKTEREVLEKLAKYEDLEEQGGMIIPPCKVGDTAYNIVYCDDKEWHMFEMKVGCINPYGGVLDGKVWNIYLEDDYTKAYAPFSAIGETVFFTPEAAEEALEKKQK